MQYQFFNVHSHRRPRNPEEFVCRNAYHFLSSDTLSKSSCPVSVGMHPWHSAAFSADVLTRLKLLTNHPQVLAIGEAGLDKRNGPEMKVQIPCWEAQFALACETGLPLIIHCVRAWQEILPDVRKAAFPLLFHDFRGNREVLNRLLPFPAVFFSFGKSLIQSPESRQVFRCIPADRILTETDQAAISIREVYRKGAEIRQVNPVEFEEQIKKNARAFFGAKALPFF